MMVRMTLVCLTMVAVLGFGSMARAADLEQMPAEMSQLYAQHLSEKFNKENQERQAKFEVDPSQSSGLRLGQDGIILVPAKGLKEGTIDPAVETETGAGLGYLFLSPCFVPLVEGKPIDAKKLRSIKFDNGQGMEREAICLLVTVKHVQGDEWRMFGFGTEKTPVVNSQFDLASGTVDKSLSLQVKDAKDKQANLELILHKKYGTSFAISNK